MVKMTQHVDPDEIRAKQERQCWRIGRLRIDESDQCSWSFSAASGDWREPQGTTKTPLTAATAAKIWKNVMSNPLVPWFWVPPFNCGNILLISLLNHSYHQTLVKSRDESWGLRDAKSARLEKIRVFGWWLYVTFVCFWAAQEWKMLGFNISLI